MRLTIEIKPGTVRRVAVLGATFAIIGAAAIAYAVPIPYLVFQSKKTLGAAQLTDNFSNIEGRLSNVESRLAALETFQSKATNAGKYGVGATFCGSTLAGTDGKFMEGSATGYAAAKLKCEAVPTCSSSAHMCTTDEIVRSASLGKMVPTGWYSAGVRIAVQGEFAVDCLGWTNNDPAYAGIAWGGKFPSTTGCNSKILALCCD